MDELTAWLGKRLENPLPGFDAQALMAPPGRKAYQEYMAALQLTPRLSAVLVLLYPVNNELQVVLIRRPDYEGVHSGQIAFPGGKVEKTDTSPVDTALREAREEVGVDPDGITIMGNLTELYIPPSNFMVYPIMAYTLKRPDFVPDHIEVAEILEIPLDALLDDRNVGEGKFPVMGGLQVSSPCYLLGGYMVWGATAMIISELKEILREYYY